VKCSDLLKLSSTSKLQLIAGKEGLDNNIRWVYFWDTVEVEDCTKWIENNELIITTGSHIGSSLELLPGYFPELVKKHVAGIIFSVGPFIKEVPSSIIESANKYRIPIFVVPWEVAIIKFSREICNTIILEEQKDITSHDLVKELVLSNNRSEEELTKIMNEASLNASGEYRVGVMKYASTNNLTDYDFVKIASIYFYNMHFKMSTSIIENRFVFIFKDKHITSGSFEEDITRFIKEEINKHQNVKCFFGVGSICNNVRDFHKSYEEALILADVCSKFNESSIRYYEQCDIPGLLCFGNSLKYRKTFFEQYLKPVVEYDALHNSNLEETLYTFIDCNLSYVNAAEKMFVHKNTLRYRIEKIEELLNLKLDNISVVSNILIAKNIVKFLEND